MSADLQAFHIASLVIWSSAPHDALLERLSEHDWIELPFPTNKGKTVVVIEAADQDALYQRIECVRALPGILNAQLVYHHGEEAERES